MTEPGTAPVGTLVRGMYCCVSTRSPLGWLIRKATASPVDHAFVYLGSGVISEATLRGCEVDEIGKYAGRFMTADVGEIMTEDQRTAVCAKAALFAGTEYAWRDLILIGLRRLGVNWGILRRVLADRDAVICSELVALSGEAGYLDWTCGTTADLVTPAMLAERPGMQRVIWPA